MIMMILALFAAIGVSLVTTGSNIGLQEEQGVQAFYIAEGGMEKAVYKFKTGTSCNPLSPTNLNETDTILGQGKFTIASTLYNNRKQHFFTRIFGLGWLSGVCRYTSKKMLLKR